MGEGAEHPRDAGGAKDASSALGSGAGAGTPGVKSGADTPGVKSGADTPGVKSGADTPGTVPVDAARAPSAGSSAGIPARRPVEADLGPLPRRLGRYEVLERIGSGGMGTVFRARQLPIDRIVALKILSPDLAGDSRYIRRFVREARAAGSLNHPNAVLVHDVGRVEGHPYICMEHVDGTTVERMLRERGRLAPDEAVSIATDVARALEKAHALGIIHRDIKPDNMLVDVRGIVKLADLGLARGPVSAGQESVTRDGIGMGTPCYMAVEQARDARRADARSDIYSLGATLYHMVTGRVPFDGDSAVDVLMRAAEDPLVGPAEIVPGMPDSVVRVIERMMAKDAASRYQTASALLADLEAVRNELAGLGPARLAGVSGPRRAPESPGRLLMKVAAALGVLVIVGLAALVLGGAGKGSAPRPVFEGLAGEAGTTVPGPGATRPPTGTEGPRRTGAEVDAPGPGHQATPEEHATPAPARPDGPPPAADGDSSIDGRPRTSPGRMLREASRRARWYERSGRYGEAAAYLRNLAARAPGRAVEERVRDALRRLYARAESDSERTLARAKGLFAAGRREPGVALLGWALDVWGLPVLEARAEAAIEEGRRELAAGAQRDAARARAEDAARMDLVLAEKKARARRFGEAMKIVDEALAKIRPEAATASKLERKKRTLKALAAVHKAIRKRLARKDFGVAAGEVFPNWAKGALIAGADAGGIEIVLPGTGGPRARKSWEILSPDEYARLVEACARRRSSEEMLGAGLAWLEAGRPDEAMRLWKTCPQRPEEGADAFVAGADKGRAAAEDALARSRRADAAGRQGEALAALAPLLALEVVDPESDKGLGLLIASLARDVEGSRGLAVDLRAGPAEAEELLYDFSRDEGRGGWRGDWRTSGSRVRQAEHAVVSPSGGLCTLEFRGPIVSCVEVTVSLRVLEEVGAGVEVAFVPDGEDVAPAASSWATVEGLETLVPLVRRPLDMIFLRGWEDVSYRARPAGAARMPREVARSYPRGVDAASAPRGPERVVVTLVGWVELRSVRLRGVIDPEWRRVRRQARSVAAAEALTGALDEKDAARRARRLEEVRAEYPACRDAGLRATREAARAHREAGDASRARAAEALARHWYPAPRGGAEGPRED